MQTKRTPIVVLALFLSASIGFAQTTPTLMTSGSGSAGVNLARGSSIIGAEVYNTQGETLGTVQDVVLNSQHDQISYVALSHGGVMGIGDKLVAVPWSEFQVQPASMSQGRESGAATDAPRTGVAQREGLRGTGESAMTQAGTAMQHISWTEDKDARLTLSASKQTFDQIAGFDQNHWPEQASANWQQQTVKADRPDMTEAQQAQFNTRRLSKVIGVKIESTTPITFRETSGATGQTGAAGQARTEIGKIKDCVMNSDNGRIIYGIVSLDQVPDRSNEMSVLPWQTIQLKSVENELIAQIQVTSSENLLAFTFRKDQTPNLADRSYLERVYTAYNVEPQWEALGFVPPSGSESGRQQPGMHQQQRRNQQQQDQQQMQMQQQRRQQDRQQQQRQGGQTQSPGE